MMKYFWSYPHHYFGFGGGFMMIFVLAFAALLVYWLVRKGHAPVGSNRALDVLDEQFALGEIDEETYLKKKKLLKK